jgi:PKHD-type hydroxylase
MILCIDGLLPPAALAELMLALPQARLEDGAATAGWAARGAKRKLQPGDRSAPRLRVQPLVEHALSSHEVFVAPALPRAISQRLVSRATAGGGHGKHVDNAIMGQPPLRTDLAFTLFLSHPSDYEGGELVIDEPQGEQCFKLPAGCGIRGFGRCCSSWTLRDASTSSWPLAPGPSSCSTRATPTCCACTRGSERSG